MWIVLNDKIYWFFPVCCWVEQPYFNLISTLSFISDSLCVWYYVLKTLNKIKNKNNQERNTEQKQIKANAIMSLIFLNLTMVFYSCVKGRNTNTSVFVFSPSNHMYLLTASVSLLVSRQFICKALLGILNVKIVMKPSTVLLLSDS